MLTETYGESCIEETTCNDWYKRFENDDFGVEVKDGNRDELEEQKKKKATTDQRSVQGVPKRRKRTKESRREPDL